MQSEGKETTTTVRLEQKLKRYVRTQLKADLSILSENEQKAVRLLASACRIMDDLFLHQVWSKNEEKMKAVLNNASLSLAGNLFVLFCFVCYIDACNLKSNQQNLGVIQCSNLCTEIVEYTAPDECAVCNLASIALPKFVNKQTKQFDFQKVIFYSNLVHYLSLFIYLFVYLLSFFFFSFFFFCLFACMFGCFNSCLK